jgi:surfeit locus 1 family protein
VLALLPCLLWLGVWQLHRADEKRALQMQFDAQRNAEPIDAAQLSAEPVAYTRAQLRGEFDNAHSFLLDNRVLHGRVGYEVLTPFVANPYR